jgi:hypothetical protein
VLSSINSNDSKELLWLFGRFPTYLCLAVANIKSIFSLLVASWKLSIVASVTKVVDLWLWKFAWGHELSKEWLFWINWIRPVALGGDDYRWHCTHLCQIVSLRFMEGQLTRFEHRQTWGAIYIHLFKKSLAKNNIREIRPSINMLFCSLKNNITTFSKLANIFHS